MTSHPLVASVCVDYLSHPLSAEGLLLCYQQITRQVAHAPLTAKEAASTFQNQSKPDLDLLQQHSYNLAIPNHRDHRGPAPVGCQAQLRRMQNALWRRSSQLSLAKDVALVQPETLNWQKECDVLWLYGPLYHPYFQASQAAETSSSSSSPSPPIQDYFNVDLSSPPIATATAAVQSIDDTTVATVTSPTALPPYEPCLPSPTSSSLSSQQQQEQQQQYHHQRHYRRMTMEELSSITEAAPRPLRSASISTSDTALAVKARTIPKKSSLKRLGTRQQQLDELRAFLQSHEYKTLSQMLAAATLLSTVSCLQQPREDGTCSAPVTPIMSNPPMLAMPLVSAPARYHFRSTDRQRRASFPKYVTHPASSSSLSPSTSSSSSSITTIGAVSFSGSHSTLNNSTNSSGTLNGKQLRFSLEVQELVFLPSSPPFRVSRAKPIRANSDPATRTAASSSFLAPSLGYRHHPHLHYHQPQTGDHTCSGAMTHSCVTTAVSTASDANRRTMVVRVGAENTTENDSREGASGPFRVSRPQHGLALDFSGQEDDFNIHFDGRRGGSIREEDEEVEMGGDYHQYRHLYSTTNSFLNGHHDKRKHHHQTHHQSTVDEVGQGADDTEPDDDMFFPTMEAIQESDDQSCSLGRLEGDMVVRRIDQQQQPQQPQQQHKGVLWQVYTVVTGVRDIVAWCGSMVYYSSTL